MKKTNLVSFEKDLLAQGGATYCIETGHVPDVGYIVSYKDTTLSVDKSVLKKAIVEFVKTYAVELSKPGNYLGGWLHEGKYVLDVSVVVMDKEAAFEMANRESQKSVYDMTNGVLFMRDQYGRWYQDTSTGRIYESIKQTYDGFHNTQRKQLKKVY